MAKRTSHLTHFGPNGGMGWRRKEGEERKKKNREEEVEREALPSLKIF